MRLVLLTLASLLLLSCSAGPHRSHRGARVPASYDDDGDYGEEQQDGPTGGEEPELRLDQILAPSLRGSDEVAEAPVRTHKARVSFSWRGPFGRRELVGWEHHSESIGSPNGGRLRDGFELDREGRGWRQRGKRPFGTDELVAAIVWAIAHVRAQYPATVPVFIGDLSQEGGGRVSPHRSHQSGRDVDIGYFVRGNRPAKRFVDVTPETMDVEKTWALLEGFLSTGMIQYVFIDYALQGVLYEEARSLGWDDGVLNQIFQFPRGSTERVGIIRHARGHDDHFHLRIHCPPRRSSLRELTRSGPLASLLLRPPLAAHLAALLGREMLDIALLCLRFPSVIAPRSEPPSTSSLRILARSPNHTSMCAAARA